MGEIYHDDSAADHQCLASSFRILKLFHVVKDLIFTESCFITHCGCGKKGIVKREIFRMGEDIHLAVF